MNLGGKDGEQHQRTADQPGAIAAIVDEQSGQSQQASTDTLAQGCSRQCSSALALGFRLESVFGFCGGLAGAWIVWPGVFWIAPAHLPPNVLIAPVPEPSKILRALQRPSCWREEFERDR